MKKYFKTYTKKSLALLMTVMMLMSCWVFVAPEHNHASAVSAADIASANQTAIGKLTGSTTINSVYGKYFPDDTSDPSTAKDLYKNVAYSGTAQRVVRVTDVKVRDNKALQEFAVWYPLTVLMYDGATTPQFGVSILKDAESSCKIVHWGTAISGTNVSFVNDQWYGVSTGSEDGKFLDSYNGSNKNCGAINTTTTTDKKNHEGDKGEWYWLSNLIKYTGSLTGNTYYTSVTPSFSTCVGQPNSRLIGNNAKQIVKDLGAASIPIYIIRTDTLKAAYTQIDSYRNLVQGNYSKYSTESVAEFVELANALMAVNPNAITWETNTATRVSDYATNAKAAVDAWNVWVNDSGLELAEYTVKFETGLNTVNGYSKTVAWGTNVEYTFSAPAYDDNYHYQFIGWTNSSDNSTGSDPKVTVTVTDDITITAEYGTGNPHNYSGQTTSSASGKTHSTKCVDCDKYSNNINCTFTNWREDGNGNHISDCTAKDLGCTNVDTHKIELVDNAIDKYKVKDKSCLEDALYYKSCKHCGTPSEETFTPENGKATGHNYVHYENDPKDVAHSCTENGTWHYACSNNGCDAYIDSPYELNANGQPINNTPVDPAAHSLYPAGTYSHTCDKAGYVLWKCDRDGCNYSEERENKDDPAAHTWADELSSIDGEKHGKICTACGKKYTEEASHDWKLIETITKPTCAAVGSGKYECEACGATKTADIPKDPNAHDYADPVSNENGTHTATCKNGCGKDAITENCKDDDNNCICDVCSYKIPHKYTAEIVNDSTLATSADCEKAATYYYSCSVCGDVDNSENAKTFPSGNPLGHSWVNTETHVKSDATCETGTIYYKECSTCHISSEDKTGDTWEADDALGHNFRGPAVDNENGTHSFKCIRYNECKTTGGVTDCDYGPYTNVDANKHQRTCSACGHIETAEHKMSAWAHVEDKTAEGKDQHSRYCLDNCGYTETATCNMEVSKVPATCLEPGYKGEKCNTCGHTSYGVDPEAPKLNHSYTGEYVYNAETNTHSKLCVNGCNKADPATETCKYEYTKIEGTDTHTAKCKVCQGTKTGNCSGGEATCTDKAVCEKCNKEYGTALGHEMTHHTKVEPTCQTEGSVEYYSCSRCNKNFADEAGATVLDSIVIEKLDHSYTGEVKANNDGTHSFKCVNGCGEYSTTEGCFGGEATCTNKAVCEKCNAEYGEALGHTMTHNAKVEPTCQTEGSVDHYNCSRCNKNFADEAGATELDSIVIKKLAHSYTGEVKANDNGTHSFKCVNGCGEYGATVNCSGGTAYCNKQAVCDTCNTSYGEFDPDRHEKNTHHEGLDATCMQEGYTAYEVCDACSKEIGKTIIPINPLNHNFGGTATPAEAGKHTLTCQNKNAAGDVQCTETTTESCADAEPNIKAPTCTDKGYTIYTCDKCAYEWKDNETPANGHTWGEWKYDNVNGGHYRNCTIDDCNGNETGACEGNDTATVIAPTCTEEGYTLHTCNLCAHEWKTDNKAPLKHDYSQKIIDEAHEYEGKGADCTQEQFYWYDCIRCDKNAKDETDFTTYPQNSLYYENGTAKGHTWEGKTVTEKAIMKDEATCTSNATYYVYCTKCGLTSKDTEFEATFEAYGSATQHNYQNIVDEDNLAKNRVSEATCSAKAVYKKSCSACGAVSNDTFEYGTTAPHSFSERIEDPAHRITRATCATAATYWYDCEHCDLSAKLIVTNDMSAEEVADLQFTGTDLDSSNHTGLVTVPVKNPTCSEAGHSEYKNCTACGAKDIGRENYTAIDHVYTGAYVIVNETDEDGNVTAHKHTRACKYGCGEHDEVVACDFSAWKQNADGETHSKTCICGNTVTASCEASSGATCTDAATCKDCGGTMGVAGGHAWGEWQSNEDGKTHFRVCENDPTHIQRENCHGGNTSGCGAIYCEVCEQQYGTGVNHSWGEWEDTTAATCTERPKHKRVCSECSEEEEVSYGSAIGHDYGEGTVETPATCTTPGLKRYTCKNNCGESYTEVIKTLGHALDANWTITTQPTCKDEGVKTKYCTHSWVIDGETIKCDYYETRPVPADKTKHVESEWIQDSTTGSCATGIRYKKVCTECGVSLDVKIEKIAHEWERKRVVNGTCTENGFIDMVCKNCHAEAVFDDTCVGYPNKFDGTEIPASIAANLPGKGGHAWRTTALEGESNYIVIDGKIVYIDKDSSCSQTGRGKMHCATCGAVSDKVTIPKKYHKYKTIPATPATCQTPGCEAYRACENCPYTEPQVRIPALGHEDANENGKCDRCGFEMYETPNGGTSACGCMCHNKSFFISKIIYPIARFFWKLFKSNHSCSCGATHY